MVKTLSPYSSGRESELADKTTGTWLNQRETARYFGVCEETLRSWDCPRVAIGRVSEGIGVRWRYNIPAVIAWMGSRTLVGVSETHHPSENNGNAQSGSVKEVPGINELND